MATTVGPRELHASAIVADTHNDLLMAVVARPPERWPGFFREQWLPQLRDGGVDVQVLPVYIDSTYRPEGAPRQTVRMIEAAHRVAEGNADEVAMCVDGAEVDAAVASGRIALVLALEGCWAVDEDVVLLATMRRLGVRVASLTHFGRTALADGSGEDATGGRLTRAGVAAVDEMKRLGILVDDIVHVAEVVGIDHVGIGPDFIAEVMHDLRQLWEDEDVVEGLDVRSCIPGLEGPRGLPLVTAALLERGLAADDVVKVLGGNVMRLLRAQLGRPGP